ncbi:hypothetical protein Fmac_020993 [Flemingia macrophylla]|uniref:Uncharacterized protein n=1 Tax=Flemingia macrophylla TaxID=520843 RepID=A0ABD1LVM6_9FABA
MARVSLIDSTFRNYEQAVIGTVLTTLNAGSVVLTIFPNFNVQLRDPTLSKRFKVQVQIVGAEQDPEAIAATLHHQLIFRLQDHCFDLPSESSLSENALMVIANQEDKVPAIVQVPKQIPRPDLEQLIPLEWISNYETFKAQTQPVIVDDPVYKRQSDGKIKAIYRRKDEPSSSNSPVFTTMMISLGDKEKRIPVYAFKADSKSIYSDKINGHFM